MLVVIKKGLDSHCPTPPAKMSHENRLETLAAGAGRKKNCGVQTFRCGVRLALRPCVAVEQ